MGNYLARPNTEKNIVMKDCRRQGIKFTLCEMQGWRRQMEDSAICENDLGDGNSLFAVFDGHGGFEVSQYVRTIFVNILKETEEYRNERYRQALFQTFKIIDKKIRTDEAQYQLNLISQKFMSKTATGAQICAQTRFRFKISDFTGCTANVALITPDEYYIANCGDSRSVLCRKGKSLFLSFDHKPENGTELERIVRAGGRVEKGRINNGLNLSRSFGDYFYKSNAQLPFEKQMVICEPDIRRFKRSQQDEFILLGCDGVFQNYLYDAQPLISKIAKERKKKKDSEDILSELLDRMLAKNTRGPTGCDNMTCILVELK